MKKTCGFLLMLVILTIAAFALGDAVISPANFPDATFRELIRNYDTNRNGSLSDAELASVTEISCQYKDITSLKGIEYFTSLQKLECDGNQLTSLDISRNTALRFLSCFSNQLTALDTSRNPHLTELSCPQNRLTALDLSMNTSLEMLNCRSNQLTTLNVNPNTALKWLYLSGNKLTSLNVSQNTRLTDLEFESNEIRTIDLSRNTALKTLNCYGNGISRLDISHNTRLTGLYCANNELTALNLSRNRKLKYLYCNQNKLTSLDVSRNPALLYMDCWDNQLKKLDLSKNTKLEILGCHRNKITKLDLTHTNMRSLLKAYRRYTTEYGYDMFGDPEWYLTVDRTVTVVCGNIISKPTAKLTEITVSGGVYRLSGSTATLKKAAGTSLTKLTIPATVKANGKIYRVTAVAADACKGLQKLKNLTIGINVKSIGKNAFYGCKSLKTITVKTENLTSGSVKAGAFKNIHKKATIKCPAKKMKEYKKLFVKKGAPKTCRFIAF